MIDKAVFAQGMGQLGGAFGREIDEPVTRMYYGILSPKLDNAEWVEAVTRTVASERFWPSPAVLLSHIKDSPEESALVAIATVRRVVGQYGGLIQNIPADAVAFDPPTWAGLKEIGGLGKVATLTDKSEKRFVRAYMGAVAPRTAIQAGGKPQPEARRIVAQTTRALTLVGRDKAAGDRDD